MQEKLNARKQFSSEKKESTVQALPPISSPTKAPSQFEKLDPSVVEAKHKAVKKIDHN